MKLWPPRGGLRGDNVDRTKRTMDVFYVNATVSPHDDSINNIEVTFETESVEHGREVAATFPKSYKVRATTLSGYTEEYDALAEEMLGPLPWGPGKWELFYAEVQRLPAQRYCHGWVTLRVGLREDGVNGGVNETGIKRARAFLAKAEKLGFTVVFDETACYSNSAT
jgi:hypothetical protein